ncbi:MAG: NAD(P)-dependent oxidoreductase [Candidatus Yanofskybacteria bacterium]|nr:NAD(P)-dependent oxidoreductase [Candidatus Yanofskybacteria bacterium]
MNSNVLVTGTRGGIGKYIHEHLGGTGFTRQSNPDELKSRSFDIIIHCACNYMPTRLVTSQNLSQYYYDNVILTEKMLQIPHRYFVFFSTVDIYPGDGQPHFEDEIVQADSVRSIYSVMKLISESVVQNKAKNYLILRPAFLIGPYMRRNNLLKLFKDPHPVLSLDASSLYNVIRYSDVLEFISLAIARKETGIFNLASADSISLADIADITGKKVVFGAHHYETGNIANQKATQVLPVFNGTSEKAIREFLAEA